MSVLRLAPPQLRTKESEGHRAATWLELFYDLVFVVAVAVISARAARRYLWRRIRLVLRLLRTALVALGQSHLLRRSLRHRRSRLSAPGRRPDGGGGGHRLVADAGRSRLHPGVRLSGMRLPASSSSSCTGGRTGMWPRPESWSRAISSGSGWRRSSGSPRPSCPTNARVVFWSIALDHRSGHPLGHAQGAGPRPARCLPPTREVRTLHDPRAR